MALPPTELGVLGTVLHLRFRICERGGQSLAGGLLRVTAEIRCAEVLCRMPGALVGPRQRVSLPLLPHCTMGPLRR